MTYEYPIAEPPDKPWQDWGPAEQEAILKAKIGFFLWQSLENMLGEIDKTSEKVY